MNHELTVDEAGSGKRIDLFVGEALSLSRAKLKALFEEGRVKLNGKKTKKGMLVVRGDRLQVEVPDARGLTPDDALPLRTLHVDEALVFIDKPAGVPSQPLKPGETGTIANALVARFPEMLELGDDEREAGLVHRLDKETSGVTVFGKHARATSWLAAAFREGRVVKEYVALVGPGLPAEGVIDLPLSRDPSRPGRWRASRQANGLSALTQFTRLAEEAGRVRVALHPRTGRTHQLRAHLTALGFPIVGDRLYGGPAGPRCLLHARRLELEGLVLESPLPADFTSG